MVYIVFAGKDNTSTYYSHIFYLSTDRFVIKSKKLAVTIEKMDHELPTIGTS